MLKDFFNLNISAAQIVHCDNTWNHKNVLSPYSRMYYILSGEGYLYSGRGKTTLKPGHLYFIPLGTKYDYHCDDSLDKIFFHINLYTDNRLDFFSDIKEIIELPAIGLERLFEDIKSDTVTSRISIKSRIYSDLLRITELCMKNLKVVSHSKTVTNALSYIDSHLSVKLKLKDIADAIYVSQSLLSKAFSYEMGISIGKYIDKCVIFEAEKMIASGKLSIEAISEDLGFCDRFYFTRRFKEHNGITPGEYKKKTNYQRI